MTNPQVEKNLNEIKEFFQYLFIQIFHEFNFLISSNFFLHGGQNKALSLLKYKCMKNMIENVIHFEINSLNGIFFNVLPS